MFCLRIKSGAECACKVLKFLIAVCLLLCFLPRVTQGQLGESKILIPRLTGASKPPGQSPQLYGGIELSDEGVKVIAMQVIEDDPGLRPIYTEMNRLSLGRISGGEFPPQASADAAKAVLSALNRLRQQYRVPLDRIYLIGSSGLSADHPKDLESVISNTTGLQLEFLDPATEVQLSIAGTIPRTIKVGANLIDNRNTSVLFHIGGASTQGGYEMLKYSTPDTATFDFIAMSIPQGMVSYTNEIRRVLDQNADQYVFTRQVRDSGALNFRKALRKELESKPGLMHRKSVYITGNLAWAMATLMYPDNRDPFVNITYDAIMLFADKIGRSPKAMVDQDITYIRDRRLRQEVDQELAEVKNTFHPYQLIAGAEMLKATAEELRWKEKKIMFARWGNLGCLTSYVRLKTGK
jgi:hypothetical protein